MRILHSIRSVNPANGGPVEAVKQLGSILNSRGHDVEVASLDSEDAPFLASYPLKVHACGPAYGKYGFSPRLLPWLRRHAAEYDAVIVNGIWEYHSVGVWHALHKSETPYYVFTHGMLDPWFKHTYPLKHLKKCLYWPLGGYPVLRDAAAVLFTTEEERVLARESFGLYRCTEKVVTYGTAKPRGDAAQQRRMFYDRFPELAGKRLILFLGRIHPKKGCDLAIEAFASTCRGHSEFQLVFAGPDEVGWSEQLMAAVRRHGITDSVTWAGMLTGDLKWGAYHASDAFLLPSHQENFGIVVAEALACGVPPLISNKVNIWREVLEDSAGFVADDDLAGTRRMLADWLALGEADRDAMRQRSRRCFETRFEIDRAADSLLSCISSPN